MFWTSPPTPRERQWRGGRSASAGVGRPNPRSFQERLAHASCTFAWSRITGGSFARSSKRTFVRGSITSRGGGASPEMEGPSPAPVPATAREGAAMRNNGIPRPNVVTRRAAAELTGVVTCYRVVRPRQQQQEQQQPRGSGGTFPAEYTAQAATTRSLYQHRHAGYCASVCCRGGCWRSHLHHD